MELVNHIVEEYAKLHTSVPDELLCEIETNTLAHHPHAQMLSGQVQGKLLAMLSQMIQPARVLEIGTFTGYSALAMAEGCAWHRIHQECRTSSDCAALACQYLAKPVPEHGWRPES